MITLKLATYSQTEVNELAMLLQKMQPHLHTHCNPGIECKDCTYRHLCMDINQATMYAEEYEATR